MTPGRDTQLGQACHMGSPPLTRINIAEQRRVHRRRLLPVKSANHPHCHHPSLHRRGGTKQIRTALGAVKDPLGPKSFRTRLMGTARVIVESGHPRSRHEHETTD